jgi:hypothetical protein
VEERYKGLGGKITVLVTEGEGHFPLAQGRQSCDGFHRKQPEVAEYRVLPVWSNKILMRRGGNSLGGCRVVGIEPSIRTEPVARPGKGTEGYCLCLGDCVLRGSALGIQSALAGANLAVTQGSSRFRDRLRKQGHSSFPPAYQMWSVVALIV